MNKKADIEQAPDLEDIVNPTNLCAEDTSSPNAICDPSLQECLWILSQSCIDKYEQFKQIGLQLIQKLARQKNIQGLAAISRLLKQSSECYAPAVEKLRANPSIIRFFDPNSANREALAKELESTNDDTIFRVVNIFLSETAPNSRDHVQALRRVLYDNYVVNDTNLDLIKKELNESYHSFNLFKEASMHLSVGFLGLQKHFTEEAHSSFMSTLYLQFDQIKVQVRYAHIVIEGFQSIENHLRKTSIAYWNKNTEQAKSQENALVISENFQKVDNQKTSIAESKARAKEVQISRTEPEISKNKVGNNNSIFTSALSKVFKSLFFRQQTPTKGIYYDEEQMQQLILKGQKKSQ